MRHAAKTADRSTRRITDIKKALIKIRALVWRPGSELNRRTRLCRPLHNHSATRPVYSNQGCETLVRRSSVLEPVGIWSGKRDSNSRPQPWQGCALPTELFPREADMLPDDPEPHQRFSRFNTSFFRCRTLPGSAAPRSQRGRKTKPLPGPGKTGAGNETRTRDLNLGKVALYQLSYSRVFFDLRRRSDIVSKNLHLVKPVHLQSNSPDAGFPARDAGKKKKPRGLLFENLERETRLELATSTLARLRSTN